MSGRRGGSGKTGVHQHYEHMSFGMNRILRRAAEKAAAEDPPEQKQPGPGRHRPISIPDELIMQMRVMHEIDGASYAQVIAAFSDQCTPAYVRSVLDGRTRANIIPKRK